MVINPTAYESLTFADPVFIDVTESLAKRIQPVVMLQRNGGQYWVPNGDIFSDDPDKGHLAPTVGGDNVRIPIMAYETESASHAALFGLGIQFALRVVHRLRELTQQKPKVVHLFLGRECTDLRPDKDSVRCYVGMAVRTK